MQMSIFSIEQSRSDGFFFFFLFSFFPPAASENELITNDLIGDAYRRRRRLHALNMGGVGGERGKKMGEKKRVQER